MALVRPIDMVLRAYSAHDARYASRSAGLCVFACDRSDRTWSVAHDLYSGQPGVGATISERTLVRRECGRGALAARGQVDGRFWYESLLFCSGGRPPCVHSTRPAAAVPRWNATTRYALRVAARSCRTGGASRACSRSSQDAPPSVA